MSNAKPVNKEDFDAEVLQATVPVLVDFHAPWCGPCKQIGPMIDEVAEELGESCKVVKVDIEFGDNSEVAVQYGVRALPTFLIFKNGQPVEQFVGGGHIKSTFISKLQDHLDKPSLSESSGPTTQ